MDAIRRKARALALVALVAAPLHANDAPAPAVLGQAPACEYRKLGTVSVEAGHRCTNTPPT